MELVADLKFILKSPAMWDHLKDFGFIQEVTGKNVSDLLWISLNISTRFCGCYIYINLDSQMY